MNIKCSSNLFFEYQDKSFCFKMIAIHIWSKKKKTFSNLTINFALPPDPSNECKNTVTADKAQTNQRTPPELSSSPVSGRASENHRVAAPRHHPVANLSSAMTICPSGASSYIYIARWDSSHRRQFVNPLALRGCNYYYREREVALMEVSSLLRVYCLVLDVEPVRSFLQGASGGMRWYWANRASSGMLVAWSRWYWGCKMVICKLSRQSYGHVYVLQLYVMTLFLENVSPCVILWWLKVELTRWVDLKIQWLIINCTGGIIIKVCIIINLRLLIIVF